MIPILLTLDKRFYNFSPGKQIGFLNFDSLGEGIIRTYSNTDGYIASWYPAGSNSKFFKLLITKVQ